MSWHSFFNAWQRIDIEEDVSSLIQSAFTRGPEVARRGSSDFRRRLTASLKARFALACWLPRPLIRRFSFATSDCVR